jgi:hypothetical protein
MSAPRTYGRWRGFTDIVAALLGNPGGAHKLDADLGALSTLALPVGVVLVSDEIDMKTLGAVNFGGNWSAALAGKKFIPRGCTVAVTTYTGGVVTTAPVCFIGNEATSSFANMIGNFTPGAAAVINAGIGAFALPLQLSGAGGLPALGPVADLTAQPKVTVSTAGVGPTTLKMRFYVFGVLL